MNTKVKLFYGILLFCGILVAVGFAAWTIKDLERQVKKQKGYVFELERKNVQELAALVQIHEQKILDIIKAIEKNNGGRFLRPTESWSDEGDIIFPLWNHERFLIYNVNNVKGRCKR